MFDVGDLPVLTR